MQNLRKQLEELQGAMILSEKMKAANSDLASLDADQYLNYIDEEEKQGHKFISIAKDIAKTEKGVLAGYFSWTDSDGQPYSPWWRVICNALLIMGLSGVIYCLFQGKWNLTNFRNGVIGVLAIFNSVVEIYKPLIKEYHTSTLMALA